MLHVISTFANKTWLFMTKSQLSRGLIIYVVRLMMVIWIDFRDYTQLTYYHGVHVIIV